MAHVRRGAAAAGRSTGDIGIGLIFHTVTSDDPDEIRAMSRSMAAGFYEYSPALFEIPGLPWNGPSVDELKRKVYPDFHHAPDLVESGRLVDFLDEETADSFSLFGSAQDIAGQFAQGNRHRREGEHRCPPPGSDANARRNRCPARSVRLPPGADYKTWFATEVMPLL